LKTVLDLLNNKPVKYERKYINYLQNYSKKITTFSVPQNLASGNASGSATNIEGMGHGGNPHPLMV
jgi:hypothetical protein